MWTQPSKSIPSERPERYELLALAVRIITVNRHYFCVWYFAYLLLGIVCAGLLPVLLPLTIEALSHKLSWVAYVTAAYNLGLLTCPAWGMLAERISAYRKLFLGSFLLASLGIVGMLLFRSLPLWLLSGFVLGAGSGGGATLGTLLVVDFAEQAEWEARLSWLQSFNATGQVVGLGLAAALAGRDSAVALWVCLTTLVLAMTIGAISLRLSNLAPLREAAGQPRRRSNLRDPAGFPKPTLTPGSGFHFHSWNAAGLSALPRAIGVQFGRFLLSWFVLGFAVAAFFSYFPLMLSQSYNIPAHTTAMIYAATSLVTIGLYALSSDLTVRYGPSRVYQSGLVLRILGFGLLLLPFVISIDRRSLFGAAGFAVIVMTWPLLNLSGTDLAARLTGFSEGTAVGLQNATMAFATVAGIVFTGPLVARWGYGTIPATALAGLAGSLLLGINF